jgi:NAD-dependent deacetylase
VTTAERAARQALVAARRVTVLTGAGMSAESGVPTFRDAQSGLWSRYDPGQLASEAGFRADPALVWRWYAERRAGVQAAAPNAGHRALAQAQARLARLAIVTQNVDGLHQRAGSRDVTELHGRILTTRCLAGCGYIEDDPSRVPSGEPPRCPRCGDWLRPGVVWFGEMLDPAALTAAEEAVSGGEVVLVVGTSGLVYPAAALPALARRAGAAVFIINPVAGELDAVAHGVVRGTAAEVLPRLFEA